MTDNAEFGIIEDKSPAYLYYIGNDTGFDAITGADTGYAQFRKYNPDNKTINTVFRAEVEYPSGSTIIIHTR